MKQFIFILSLLFLLLIFHEETVAGTQNGLLLWYQVLIPSLLPFILVTNALSETNAYQAAALKFKKLFHGRIYHIMAVFLGNLCGYPIGGKILNDFVANRYITPEDANRLLSLSSQASPMFLIGYVYVHIIQKQLPLWIFLLGIYLPVILYYPFLKTIQGDKTVTITHYSSHSVCITDTFLHAVRTMVMIGMYVIIFSILLCILLPFCIHTPSRFLLSFLEITTGLKLMQSLPLSDSLRLSCLCALSAFGGLCSAFQIRGVLTFPEAGIKKYLLDKLVLSAGTFLIIWFYCNFR